MPTYIIRQYYLNETPPREIETELDAPNAVDAIRSIKYWEYADQFTHLNHDPTIQAHTQDGDGRNGCHAEMKGN